ncbi:hypothetical protein VTN77DRAFT_4033 [Rasamsonia byssochlamydoides]|uniref:uncharacterized protein n=1 Tax=Rasamsonia byssochlamydoides TaxID=89139 RepID=UPI0037433EF9
MLNVHGTLFENPCRSLQDNQVVTRFIILHSELFGSVELSLDGLSSLKGIVGDRDGSPAMDRGLCPDGAGSRSAHVSPARTTNEVGASMDRLNLYRKKAGRQPALTMIMLQTYTDMSIKKALLADEIHSVKTSAVVTGLDCPLRHIAGCSVALIGICFFRSLLITNS